METLISKAIIQNYMQRLSEAVESDVVIVGGGPAGLVAGYFLARASFKTVILEKRLALGGGIWGGAAGFNLIALEKEAQALLNEFHIDFKNDKDLLIVDACEFATALGYQACRAGVRIFNLVAFEDLIVKGERVAGVVVNNTTIKMAQLPVDPFCLKAEYVIDATGHPAEVASILKQKVKRDLFADQGEGPMNVLVSEKEVVAKTGEIYPGLMVAGMAVCAVYGLPRMGPIFGGMLASGRKVAQIIIERRMT